MTENRATPIARWKDPDPDLSPGILLSDRIRFYVDNVNLIEPFREDSLGPASYDLHVGDQYNMDDKRRKPQNGRIVIPKNGLVYVTLEEKLNIPFYMIAQHDLRVKQEYRGFLAGRSTLIDPGYSGHIHYPIYNFTDEDKVITVGQKITTICFIKTTAFGSAEFQKRAATIESEAALLETSVLGLDGHECEKFQVGEDRPVEDYWAEFPDDRSHTSSVAKIRRDVRKIQRTMKLIRRFGYVAALALVLGTIGIAVKLFADLHSHQRWTSDKVMSVQRDMSEISASLQQTQLRLRELSAERRSGQSIGFASPADVSPEGGPGFAEHGGGSQTAQEED